MNTIPSMKPMKAAMFYLQKTGTEAWKANFTEQNTLDMAFRWMEMSALQLVYH